MEVVSICPLRAGSVLWETASGALTLTVVAKATYSLRPGESPLATAQEAPTESDEHWNDDEQRSLHAPSDLAPFKRRADVILVGHAFAPGAIPVRSLIARLVVGEVDKSIEVFGERAFTIEGHLREGAPFAKMPLRWERAAGGPDTMNPVGMRMDARGAITLPSLQPIGIRVTSPSDYIAPTCFGPIAASWPTRLARLSVSAAGWDFRHWRDRRLPQDLDPSFFNVAPSDQQVDVLRPSPRIVLENLHPDHPTLVTTLASATPRVVIDREAGLAEEVGMRCDTLLIDTDRATCSLTWRAQIPITDPHDARRVTRVIVTTMRAGGRPEETAKPRISLETQEMAPPSKPVAIAPASAIEETVDGTSAASLPALPFRVGRSTLAGMVLGVPAQETDSWSETTDEHTSPASVRPAHDALPFVAGARGSDLGLDIDEEETHTDLPRDLAQLVASTVAPTIAQPWRAITEDVTADLSPARSFELKRSDGDPISLDRSDESFELKRSVPAEPPPMIGPLATPEMISASTAEPKAKEIEVAVEPAAPMPEPAPALPLDAYPIERCAAIAASIARSKEKTDRVLADHELTPDLWNKLDRHWADHVRKASGRGRTAPLKVYDAAYVAQLERERGPIRPEDYAQIVVSVERASTEETLSSLGLPRGALLRVQRVWLGRTASDADLGKTVRRAIDAAREA